MTLTIAVLTKQVPDFEALIQVKSDQELDIENRYVTSFFDEVAVQAALDLKQAHPEAELIALSAGGKRAVEALRRAVAMGIDRVERLGDEPLASADSLAVAEVLARRLKELQPQLILCGKQAGDDDQAAVGPMLAELLEMPLASGVLSLQLDPKEGLARFSRKQDGDRVSLEARLPLLVTAEKGLAEPHVPVVTRVMKAMKAQIESLPAELDSAHRVRRLRYSPPPARPRVRMIDNDFPENVSELVRLLLESGTLG